MICSHYIHTAHLLLMGFPLSFSMFRCFILMASISKNKWYQLTSCTINHKNVWLIHLFMSRCWGLTVCVSNANLSLTNKHTYSWLTHIWLIKTREGDIWYVIFFLLLFDTSSNVYLQLHAHMYYLIIVFTFFCYILTFLWHTASHIFL